MTTESYDDEIVFVDASGKRKEDPNEIIEPGDRLLYEQVSSDSAYSDLDEELYGRLDDLLEQYDGEVVPVSARKVREMGFQTEFTEKTLDEAYDKIIMGVTCGCCHDNMLSGQLRNFKREHGSPLGDVRDSDVDLFYATPEEREQHFESDFYRKSLDLDGEDIEGLMIL